MNRRIKYIGQAVTWRDKVNGNTYHSVTVTRCRDGKRLACPMTYGYGDQYRQTALSAMAAAKWLPTEYRDKANMWRWERENGYPVEWTVKEGLKRECIAHGGE